MQILRDGGLVAVFAEGTTTSGRPVLPFRSGLLKAATAAACDVQPLVLRYREEAQARLTLLPPRLAGAAPALDLAGELHRDVQPALGLVPPTPDDTGSMDQTVASSLAGASRGRALPSPARSSRSVFSMCLVALAIGQSERFPWVLASNRDEYFDRDAAPLAWWQPPGAAAPILAGRDLSAGGTWLGLNAQGRLALVTNVREPGRFVPASPSRGDLVPQWLQPGADRVDSAAWLAVPRNGFNLLAADLTRDAGVNAAQAGAQWLSNRAGPPQALRAGVHGLSNAALGTPWPKTRRLVQAVQARVPAAEEMETLTQALWAALADRTLAADAELPATGVPLDRERQLSAIFIRMPAADAGGRDYGTRCSTVVVAERWADHVVVHVRERRFDASGAISGETAVQFTPERAR